VMEATVILCDWAEVVNAKLYIQGAGWTRIAANVPAQIAIAIQINVSWDQANEPHGMDLALLDPDGQSVTLAVSQGEGQPLSGPFRIQGKFEVGRPPGTTKGSALPALMAFKFPLIVNPGRYIFELKVDGEASGSAPFEAFAAPSV
jgi:hypothetical protein